MGNKAVFYTKNVLRLLVPTFFYERQLQKKLRLAGKYNAAEIYSRVDYYNQLQPGTSVGAEAVTLKNMPPLKRPKAYSFDTYDYTRYFSRGLKANFLFGDVTHVATVPTIQKSRPVGGDNANAVILKLDKKRHFVFVKDTIPFAQKKNLLIGRGVTYQSHRIKFMEMYFSHPLCDIGQVNRTGNLEWLKPKLSLAEHLKYKFVLSLEGNDVATNLKWVMSSNSIAVMPKPKYETWFMEGCLIANHHYILIKDDYSDLEERLNYYIQHTAEAEAIIKNANAWVTQFLDTDKEGLLSLLVLKKYFECTGQTV